MASPVAASYPLDTRSTEQRTVDAITQSPEVRALLQSLVEAEVNEFVRTIVATVFPALSGASMLRYEMRRSGTGVWESPSTLGNLVAAFKHGRTVRLIAEFEKKPDEDAAAEGVTS